MASFLRSLLTGLLLAFLFFGAAKSFEASGEGMSIVGDVVADPVGAGSSAACYGLAFNSITPSVRSDWLPAWLQPKGSYLFLVEDVPLPDTTDFFILGVAVLVTLFILRFTLWRSTLGAVQKFLWAVLILVLVFVAVWLAWKLVMYLIMFGCGENLGLSRDAIVAGREAAITGSEAAGIVIPSLLLALFGGLTVLRAMVGGSGK